jgi:hypothetical protein
MRILRQDKFRYKSLDLTTVTVKFCHLSHGQHYRRDGFDPVKDASFARAGGAGASHP